MIDFAISTALPVPAPVCREVYLHNHMLSITQTHKCLTLMREEVVLNHAEKKIVIGSGLKLPKSVVFQITLAHLSSNEGEGRIKFQGPILKQ